MIYVSNEPARKWMWLLVAIFVILIAALWGWSFKVRLASFSWQNTPENKLVEKSQNDWDELFREAEANQNKTILEEQVKNLIKQISVTSTINSATP